MHQEWHHHNFLPTVTNHQTHSSFPVSPKSCLHFPWSYPAAKNVFLCHDHTSLFTDLSASHSVLTKMRHTNSTGVERGSSEGRATQMIQWLGCSAELWHCVSEETNCKVWVCEECHEGGSSLKKKRKKKLPLHHSRDEMKAGVSRPGRGVSWLYFFIRFCVWLVQNVCNRNAAENSVVVTNTQNIERKPKQYIS